MFNLYWEIFGGAIASIYEYRSAFFRTLVLPVIALSLLELYELIEGPIFGEFFVLFLHLIIYTLIAVTTHRIILLGPSVVSIWNIYRWSKRETRFAIYVFLFVLMMIILGVFGFVLNIIAGMGVFIILTLIFIIGGRFSLVFPGIAIDQKVTFDDSWNWTRGHTILMFVVVGVVPYLIFIPILFVSSLLPYELYFTSLLGSVALIFEISLISHAYKAITNEYVNR